MRLVFHIKSRSFYEEQKLHPSRILTNDSIATSIGRLVQGDSAWYLVVSSDSSDDRYGDHYGSGVKIASASSTLAEVIENAGKTLGKEKETGFNVEISHRTIDKIEKYVADVFFIPGDPNIWEKTCDKHNGTLPYRTGYRCVAFNTQEEAESAVDEARTLYEQEIYGEN